MRALPFEYYVKGAVAVAVAALLAPGLFPAAASAEPDAGTATTISVVSTLVPCALAAAAFTSDSPELGWALTAAGVYLGPATGYVYGGLPGRGLAGVGVRAGLSVFGMLGVGSMFDETTDARGGVAVALVAAAGIAAAMAWDVATVGRDVHRRNERRAVSVVPWRSRAGAPGLALLARF